MILDMANLQRVVISLLLLLTASFLVLAQGSSAAKGPKITSKVAFFNPFLLARADQLTAPVRSISILPMEMRSWAES